MANGRNTVHRRKSRQTARNKKPRISSPEGVKERHDIRANNVPSDPTDKKLHFIKPGSHNPRKVGR